MRFRIGRARMPAWLLLLGLAGFIACHYTYVCTMDIECADVELRPGLCLHDGRTGFYCAQEAPVVCPSKWRWAPTAEESIARRCVNPALLPKDAGADLTPLPDASGDY